MDAPSGAPNCWLITSSSRSDGLQPSASAMHRILAIGEDCRWTTITIDTRTLKLRRLDYRVLAKKVCIAWASPVPPTTATLLCRAPGTIMLVAFPLAACTKRSPIQTGT